MQTPSLEGPTLFAPMSSYGIFLQGNQQYSSFLGFGERTFPWELVPAALCGGKDMQVIYLLVPSGSCLKSPLLQSTGKVYPASEQYAQERAAWRPGCPLHAAQHSIGLDLLKLTVLWITNTWVYSGHTVRIATLPCPWALCNSLTWCALQNVSSVTSLGGITEGQMGGFSRFLFEL